MKNKNFQRKYTQKLSSILNQLERDNNIGEMCLIFPNPDWEVKKSLFRKRHNYVTSEKAAEIFDEITQTSLDYP